MAKTVIFSCLQLVSILFIVHVTGRGTQEAAVLRMDEPSIAGGTDVDMLQMGSEMPEEQNFRCESRADESCVAMVVESLLNLEENISSSFCKHESSCPTVESASSLDVDRLRKQLTTLEDEVYLEERKRQDLLEILVSPHAQLKALQIHLENAQTLHEKLVATSSRTALLVAMMYHNLTTELSRAVLDQRVAVEGIFERSSLITEDLEALLQEIQSIDLELNDTLPGLIFSRNFSTHKILLRQISHGVNITVNSTEGVNNNAQSTSLVTVDVIGRVSEYGEFFHASLHLLDHITEGISSVWVWVDNVTSTVDLLNIFSGNVADLDSKVSDVFNSIINKLRSAAKEFAYFNNLVQGSLERTALLDDLLSELVSYKEEVTKVENTLPAVLQHADHLHKQVEIISMLLEIFYIPSPADVLETLNKITNMIDVEMELLRNTPLSTRVPILQSNDSLQVARLLAHDINTLHSQTTSDKLHRRLSQVTLLVGYLNSTLYNVSEGECYTELKEGTSRAMKDQASVSQCIDETASLVVRAGQNVNNSISRVDIIRYRVLPTSSSDSKTVALLSSNIRAASQLINDLYTPFLVVLSENYIIEQLIELTNQSLGSVESEMENTASVLDSTDNILLNTYDYLSQVSLPVQFDNGTVISLNPQLRGLNEFRKVSFTMKSNEVHDCVILHLNSFFENTDYVMSVAVGIQNGSLSASFVFTQPRNGEAVSINLTVIETKIDAGKRYMIEATRTDRIMHLLLHNLDTEESYSTSDVLSKLEYSSFRKLHSERVSLFVGGTLAPSSELQDTLFSNSMNYSGCISDVTANGIEMELWTAALSSDNHKLLRSCDTLSSSMLKPLQIKCGGAEFATGKVEEGSLLPLKIDFSTFQQNTLLLYADNVDEASSLQVSLVYGYIVVRILSIGRRRTLTSQETYSKGSKQSISLSLSRSQRSLILTSAFEETSRGLRQIETSAVLNFTRIFVGGSPALLQDGVRLDADNLTGCIAVSSLAVIQPTPLQCVLNQHVTDCTFCSDQAVFSASFYGASYSSFPQITIGTHFDISFNFMTSFSSGLLFHAGNASKGNWFTMKLVKSHLQVLFGNQHLSGLSFHPPSGLLNDSKWHSITFLRIESSLEIYVDGREAGNYPFGGLFPLGTIDSNITIGGLSPLSRQLVLPGLPTAGFKGHIADLYMLGQAYDFFANSASNFVNFNVCEFNNTCENSTDVCMFTETSFAEYDLGRFEPNFSLGFQLRTIQSIAVLFYIFSRRRTDAFVVQLTDGKLGFYAKSDEPSDSAEVLASSGTVTSDGEWHSVVIEKFERNIALMIDDVLVAETVNAPLLMRTNSELYIGGLPSDRRIPLPDVTPQTGFTGHLRMNFLPHSTFTGDVQCGSHVT